MKKQILFITLLLCSLFATHTSCTINTEVPGESRTALNITTSIMSKNTRAPQLKPDGAGNFTDNDEISLFITYNIGGNQQETRSIDFTINEQLYWEDMKFPTTSNNFRFTGCYPTAPADATGNPEEYVWETQDKITESEKDLLLAEAVYSEKGSTTPIILQFRHALHKLEFKLESKDASFSQEELENASLTILGTKSASVINLRTGRVTGARNNYDFSGSGKNISFMLPEQPVSGLKLKFDIGTYSQTIDFPTQTSSGGNISDLESGKNLDLYFNIGKKGINLEFIDISGWQSQGSIDGEIEI